MEQSLKEIWSKHTETKKFRNKETSKVFHFCNVVRHSMSHFVKNLYSYLMVAIESAWDEFLQKLKNAKHFDQIINLHRDLVDRILDITMVTQKNVNTSMNNVFNAISSFNALQINYHQEVDDYSQKLIMYENNKKMMDRGLSVMS